MTKKGENKAWKALKLTIKINDARHAMEEARESGNKNGAEEISETVQELENEARKLNKGDK